MTRRVKLRAAVLIAAIVPPVLAAAMWIDNWKRDLTVNVATTDAAAQDPAMRPLDTSAPLGVVNGALLDYVASHPQWGTPQDSQPPPGDSSLNAMLGQAGPVSPTHFVHTTKLLRFKDDVWVVVEPRDDGGSRVHVHSQSRVGKADFGQNPRNIRELLNGLRQRLEDF